MIKIDRSEWPLVYIEVDAVSTLAAMEEYNQEMEKLLDYAEEQPEKFGMIYISELTDAETKSQKREKEAKQLANKWLKANRPRIGENCVGIAMVMPNANLVMKMMRPIAKRSMKKMMGAPGDMFFNQEDAVIWMQEQMATVEA
ncbi:MAG: hypothetical protein AAF633_27690 [Chloroflexota bacterium]